MAWFTVGGSPICTLALKVECSPIRIADSTSRSYRRACWDLKKLCSCWKSSNTFCRMVLDETWFTAINTTNNTEMVNPASRRNSLVCRFICLNIRISLKKLDLR